jgi:hypothetical protein
MGHTSYISSTLAHQPQPPMSNADEREAPSFHVVSVATPGDHDHNRQLMLSTVLKLRQTCAGDLTPPVGRSYTNTLARSITHHLWPWQIYAKKYSRLIRRYIPNRSDKCSWTANRPSTRSIPKTVLAFGCGFAQRIGPRMRCILQSCMYWNE